MESNLIVVANGRFAGGGMMFAPHAELDDGQLDIILTDGISRLGIMMELRRIGSGGHLKNPKVSEASEGDFGFHETHWRLTSTARCPGILPRG